MSEISMVFEFMFKSGFYCPKNKKKSIKRDMQQRSFRAIIIFVRMQVMFCKISHRNYICGRSIGGNTSLSSIHEAYYNIHFNEGTGNRRTSDSDVCVQKFVVDRGIYETTM